MAKYLNRKFLELRDIKFPIYLFLKNPTFFFNNWRFVQDFGHFRWKRYLHWNFAATWKGKCWCLRPVRSDWKGGKRLSAAVDTFDRRNRFQTERRGRFICTGSCSNRELLWRAGIAAANMAEYLWCFSSIFSLVFKLHRNLIADLVPNTSVNQKRLCARSGTSKVGI